MKLREIMTRQVIRIHPEEPVAVAARMMTQYNVGLLPVCGRDGRLLGVVTDRDMVVRCLASGRDPERTRVDRVMTPGVIAVSVDTDGAAAARVMAGKQIRRLPVTENGRLCGMVSLGDLARSAETAYDAGDALAEISAGVSNREL